MKIYVVPDPNETKFQRFKREVKARYEELGDWFNRNKEEAVKNLYCYDRSLGHYWCLRRELSNKEWLEIDQRKKNGERLSDILAELKVLK